MATFKVNVNKLNLRSSPVMDFADKGNVVGVLHQNTTFESVSEITNNLGTWLVNADGYYIWQKGNNNSFTANLIDSNLIIPFINYNNLIKDIPDEWRVTKGENVKVVILDTGVSNVHKDIKIGSINYFNFCDETKNKFDESGHGTKVAGIIGANAPIGSRTGICGVAPLCEIISYKISNDGSTDPKFIQNAIPSLINLARKNNFVIANCSWDVTQSKELDDLFTTIPQNLIFICAAGNNSELSAQGGSLKYPASLSQIISVGYIRQDLFSSIISSGPLNPLLDFIYIGNAIKTSSIPNENSYSDFDKCSMSTAVLSGIVALLLSSLKDNPVNSELIKNKLKSQFSLIPTEISDSNLKIYKIK